MSDVQDRDRQAHAMLLEEIASFVKYHGIEEKWREWIRDVPTFVVRQGAVVSVDRRENGRRATERRTGAERRQAGLSVGVERRSGVDRRGSERRSGQDRRSPPA